MADAKLEPKEEQKLPQWDVDLTYGDDDVYAPNKVMVVGLASVYIRLGGRVSAHLLDAMLGAQRSKIWQHLHSDEWKGKRIRITQGTPNKGAVGAGCVLLIGRFAPGCIQVLKTHKALVRSIIDDAKRESGTIFEQVNTVADGNGVVVGNGVYNLEHALIEADPPQNLAP